MTRKSYREHQAIDDYTKLFSGLLLMALGFGRRLGPIGGTIVTVIGASKVAEGVSGYSPVNDLLRMLDVDYAKITRQFPWISRHWIKLGSDGQRSEEPEQTSSSSSSYNHRQYMSDDAGYPI